MDAAQINRIIVVTFNNRIIVNRNAFNVSNRFDSFVQSIYCTFVQISTDLKKMSISAILTLTWICVVLVVIG